MKRHIEGTNNRTLCGNKVNDRTLLLSSNVPEFMSDCDRCLGRLADDKTKMIQFMNLMNVVCKNTETLYHVTRLHKQQLKAELKRKHEYRSNEWEKRNLQ